MPPKSTKTLLTVPSVTNENTLEKLQFEWTTVAKELALAHDKIDELNTRREDLASRMWKQMNKNDTDQKSSNIVETPSVDIEVSEVSEVSGKVTKSKSKAKDPESKKTKDVEPEQTKISESKKSKDVVTKTKPKTKPEVEVEVIKKTPVKKVVKKVDTTEVPATKSKTVKSETEDLKAKMALMNNSSSSDTDLESLSSCSSGSECSGGED